MLDRKNQHDLIIRRFKDENAEAKGYANNVIGIEFCYDGVGTLEPCQGNLDG